MTPSFLRNLDVNLKSYTVSKPSGLLFKGCPPLEPENLHTVFFLINNFSSFSHLTQENR